MIELVTDAWAAIDRARKNLGKVTSFDVMTGYLGGGASKVLAELRVSPARIVFGLNSTDGPLPRSLAREIDGLRKAHHVRVSRGLHSKVYIINDRVVLLGSANFSRSAFEQLQEAAVLTDNEPVVRAACALFRKVWAGAKQLDARVRISKAARSPDDEEIIASLGRIAHPRKSPFSQVLDLPSSSKYRSGAFKKIDGLTVLNYKRAFATIKPLTKHHMELLHAHLRAPRHEATMTELARAVGYRHSNAVKRHYGELAARLARALRVSPKYHIQILVIEQPRESKSDALRLRLRPKVVAALDSLGWLPSGRTSRRRVVQSSGDRKPVGSNWTNRQPAGLGGSATGIVHCVRIHKSAFDQDDIDALDRGGTRDWGAAGRAKIKVGDIHLFCTGPGPWVPSDCVHSIWEARSTRYRDETMFVKDRANFRRLVRLMNPVPKSALFQAGLLVQNRWPQGLQGKVIHSRADLEILASTLIRLNPGQSVKIRAALGVS